MARSAIAASSASVKTLPVGFIGLLNSTSLVASLKAVSSAAGSRDGAAAIIASYQGNGDSVNKNFDAITYGSAVAPGTDGWIVITFSDHITHAGTTLHHTCEQWVKVGEHNTITRIEHHDLPGQADELAAFKKAAGV